MECRIDDKECWGRASCQPADFVCQTFRNNPVLFENVLGQQCRDEECTVKGKYLSELIHPVLKACSEEAAGDSGKFAACLLDMADLLDEIPKFVDSVPGVQSLTYSMHETAKEEKGKAPTVYVDKRAEELYGPFPTPPCDPKDYACVSYWYGELHRYAVGSEGCYDQACSKRGFRPAWILWPVLKACGEEAKERNEFYSCLKGVASLLRSVAQQFR